LKVKTSAVGVQLLAFGLIRDCVGARGPDCDRQLQPAKLSFQHFHELWDSMYMWVLLADGVTMYWVKESFATTLMTGSAGTALLDACLADRAGTRTLENFMTHGKMSRGPLQKAGCL
jgi:hypothetical protein